MILANEPGVLTISSRCCATKSTGRHCRRCDNAGVLARQRQSVRIGTAAATGKRRRDPAIVGRDRELASLRRALLEAGRGARQAVVVSGEAGIGKTALLTAFLREARRTRARVLSAECFEAEAARPFAPFAAIAAQLDRMERGMGTGPNGLDQVRRLFAQHGAQRATVHEPERWQIDGAFAQVFRSLCLEQTLMLAIEDVQWADAASRELLLYVMRKLRDLPLLLAVTSRRTETAGTDTAAFIAELTRLPGCAELVLGPLDRRATAALIANVLQLEGRPEREFAIDMHRHTEGHALLTEELLDDLTGRAVLTHRDGAWYLDGDTGVAPRSVTETVRARLEALAPDTRRLLRAAAVLGHRFTYDALIRMSGAGAEALTDALRSAVDAHLVVIDGDGYRFRHALVREAVLATLLAPERNSLHAAAARALVGTAGDAELADHYEASGDLETAARHHVAAGLEAYRLMANTDALRHAERALDLGTLDPSLGDLLLRVMEIAHTVAEPGRGLAYALRTKTYFERRGDARNTAHAVLWIGAHRERLGDSEGPRAARREALAILEPLGESKELALARIGTAAAVRRDGRPAEAIRIAEAAVEMARRVGDAWSESFGLSVIAHSLVALDRRDEAVTLVRRRLAAARRADVGSIRMIRVLDDVITLLSTVRGTRDERARLLREATELARRADVLSTAATELELMSCFDEGDWDRLIEFRDEIASFDSETRWSDSLGLIGLYLRLMRDGDGASAGELDAVSATIRAKGDPGFAPIFVSRWSWPPRTTNAPSRPPSRCSLRPADSMASGSARPRRSR